MAIDVTKDLRKNFSYKGMQELMGYLSTFNCESQTLAVDANANDIQTTGTKMMFINGQPEVCEADAALDISADTTEVTQTAWATATAYSTVGTVRWNKDGVRYRSIAAHTSSVNDEPGYGQNWETYWELAPHGAVNAVGATIAASYDRWFMVTAQADGTITMWLAGDAAATGYAKCVIPQYDHKIYCPIGFIHVANGTSSAFTVGTTSFSASSVTTTFMDVTGPVFPDLANWDKN
jgi:hypothetical protein